MVRFSRARRRYERQGALVEEAALQKAEEECLSDADVRARGRERAAARRIDEDEADRPWARAKVRREIDEILRAWGPPEQEETQPH